MLPWVVEAEISLAVAGLVVAGVEARIVVASMETCLEYADLIATHPLAWRCGPVARAEAEARARRARAPDTIESRIREYRGVA